VHAGLFADPFFGFLSFEIRHEYVEPEELFPFFAAARLIFLFVLFFVPRGSVAFAVKIRQEDALFLFSGVNYGCPETYRQLRSHEQFGVLLLSGSGEAGVSAYDRLGVSVHSRRNCQEKGSRGGRL
jgi:hypothetical protein